MSLATSQVLKPDVHLGKYILATTPPISPVPAVGLAVRQTKGKAMRSVQIRASSEQELDCLLRELAAYCPKLSRREVVIELEEDSQTELLAMLSVLETCLEDNEIRSIRVRLDGRNYTMAT